MICKECIHYDLCKGDDEERYLLDVSRCKYFADKSLFVVLPCKVGDMVYMYNRNKTMVQEMVFDSPDIRCHCTKDDEFSCCMPVCNDYQNGICAYRFHNDFSEIGKTVFLTREEAEKALERRKEK